MTPEIVKLLVMLINLHVCQIAELHDENGNVIQAVVCPIKPEKKPET